MFGKNKDKPNEKVDTIIGNGTSFNGSLNVEGSIRIDGDFEGEINSNGNVVIGRTGRAQAKIKGYNASVAGEVKGNINLEGKLEINSTGKVFGDIEVAKLLINEGAIFKGESKMFENGEIQWNDDSKDVTTVEKNTNGESNLKQGNNNEPGSVNNTSEKGKEKKTDKKINKKK